MAARSLTVERAAARQSDAPAFAEKNGLTKSEAELLLDWLECSGVHGPVIHPTENGLFSVTWPHGGKQNPPTA
jgi:hypothetical protein